MDVLIITNTRASYEATVQSYDRAFDRRNKYHWIRTRDQMYGYRMPVQIRFVGDWGLLPDAPSLEDYAAHITAMGEATNESRG